MVSAVLIVVAGGLTLLSGLTNPNRMPLWIPVLLLCIALLVGVRW